MHGCAFQPLRGCDLQPLPTTSLVNRTCTSSSACFSAVYSCNCRRSILIPSLCSAPSTAPHRYHPRLCHCLQRSVLLASPARHKPPEASYNAQIRIISTASPGLWRPQLPGSPAQPCFTLFPYHCQRPAKPGRTHRLILTLTPLRVLSSVRLHSDNPADLAQLQRCKVRRLQ